MNDAIDTARRTIRDARGLLDFVAGQLGALGLDPECHGDTITFEFLGHVHRLELEDLERRCPGIGADEEAMIAAGLAIG